jgi:hypothetical protein
MNNLKHKQAVLFASDSRGIYIPQHFAESYNTDHWLPINSESIEALKLGPHDCDDYWDIWCEVMDNAETVCGGSLWQDGDLWIVWPQLAIDAVNECCSQQLEYEESHVDAGNNYAHMVSESWCTESEERLAEQFIGKDVTDLSKDCFEEGRWIPEWTIDTMGLDIDVLSDMAIYLFEMVPGHMFGPYTNGIILGSYSVGEIEIDLDHLGIDGITMDLIRESCEAYISGTSLAYMTTDAVWYAVVDPAEYQAAIIEYKESNL